MTRERGTVLDPVVARLQPVGGGAGVCQWSVKTRVLVCPSSTTVTTPWGPGPCEEGPGWVEIKSPLYSVDAPRDLAGGPLLDREKVKGSSRQTEEGRLRNWTGTGLVPRDSWRLSNRDETPGLLPASRTHVYTRLL